MISAADSLLVQLQRTGIEHLFVNGGTDFPPIAEAFAGQATMARQAR